MTFNFLGPGLTVNVEAKVKEQIILDSSDSTYKVPHFKQFVTRSGTNTSIFILSGDYISKLLLVF